MVVVKALTHEEFLKIQHPMTIQLSEILENFQDLLAQGQISRHGVAVCCHVESLIALLERYKDGTATIVHREEWNTMP